MAAYGILTHVISIRHEHPDRCTAARCGVPSALEIVVATVDDASGGCRFQQRVCIGHYLAFKVLAMRVPHLLRVMTLAEVMQERQRRGMQNIQVTFTTTGSTGTWTAWTPNGF